MEPKWVSGTFADSIVMIVAVDIWKFLLLYIHRMRQKCGWHFADCFVMMKAGCIRTFLLLYTSWNK